MSPSASRHVSRARGARRHALPPALHRRWRGSPRLLLEDTPAPQLARLLPLQADDRLLALGRDAPPLAAELADAGGLRQTPLALLGRRPSTPAGEAARLGVAIVRGHADRLPLPDGAVSVIVVPHQLRRWTDERLARVLQEAWRVLAHNGVCALWEVAPSRSPQVNALWRAWLGGEPQLRSFAQLGRAAYDAGFAWVQTLPLRPFLWPPGPRVSVLLRKEHYTEESVRALHSPHAPGERP